MATEASYLNAIFFPNVNRHISKFQQLSYSSLLRIIIFTTGKQSFGQGYDFAPVCQSFCSRGGCPIACWDTYTPPWADFPGQTVPPWADTPPLGRHPSLGQTPPWGRHPSPDITGYAQPAGGTHPTGKHTCSFMIILVRNKCPIYCTINRHHAEHHRNIFLLLYLFLPSIKYFFLHWTLR